MGLSFLQGMKSWRQGGFRCLDLRVQKRIRGFLLEGFRFGAFGLSSLASKFEYLGIAFVALARRNEVHDVRSWWIRSWKQPVILFLGHP